MGPLSLFFFKMCLFLLKVRRSRERERNLSSTSSLWSSHVDAGTKALGLSFTVFCRCISRKLDLKWSSRDSNQCLYGLTNHRRWLHVLHHSVGLKTLVFSLLKAPSCSEGRNARLPSASEQHNGTDPFSKLCASHTVLMDAGSKNQRIKGLAGGRPQGKKWKI